MKNDFKGIGLIFDVYDNDNRRNNPSVFVIENDGKSRQYDHDHDYENDIIKTMPEDHTLSGLTHGKYQSYKCVADFRNAHSNTKVLVKFLHKALHVYLDTESSSNYKFCLVVQFDRDFRDYHMAFTAATGQVADNHDVEFIETSYLADSDLEFDDSLLEHFASNASGSLVNTVSDLLVFILSFALTGFAGWQLFGFKKMMAERLDEVRVCHTLNKHVSNHFMAHFAFCLLLLFNGMYLLLLLHVPLAGMRVYLLSKKKHIFTASAISGQAHKDHPLGAFAKIYSTSTRLISSLVLYGVTLLYILFMLI